MPSAIQEEFQHEGHGEPRSRMQIALRAKRFEPLLRGRSVVLRAEDLAGVPPPQSPRRKNSGEPVRWHADAIQAIVLGLKAAGAADCVVGRAIEAVSPPPCLPRFPRERGQRWRRIGTVGPAVVRPHGSGSGQPAMGQGGPVARAAVWMPGAGDSANGSTGVSPMKKPRIWRMASRFRCNQSRVLPSFLSCS
jgi:hypothetical protein